MDDSAVNLEALRGYFRNGETLSWKFRSLQLSRLEDAVMRHEKDIAAALWADLGKSETVAWATETGLVLRELRQARRRLRAWMRPVRVRTDLLTFPSSARIYREPLGVVLVIAPWNYPLQLAMIPLAGALAAGNCVVVKPSELAPATAAVIQRIIEETFPPHYVRVVQGEGAAVVPAMMRSFTFDHVFYTGGLQAGRAIYQLAAEKLVPVTLELGGKSPCIVYEDASLRVAARRIVLGKYVNAGQSCIAPDYLLVQEGIMDRMLVELKEALDALFAGAREQGDYGKMIHLKRFDQVAGYIKNGTVALGGASDRASLFIEPTVLAPVKMSDAVMQEEIFGPVLPVLPFRTTTDAMEMVQQHEQPLSCYVFTGNRATARLWIDRVKFGGGCINNTVWQFTNSRLPFGGTGNSGMGAYHGKSTFDLFSHAKPVLRTATFIDPSLKYPPYGHKLRWFKKLIR